MAQSFLEVGAERFSTDLLAEVSVSQALNEHWTCHVLFRATRDARPDVESMQGKPLRIATTDLAGTEHVLFSGIVQTAQLRFESWGTYQATLAAVSLCWKMGLTRHHAYFLKQAPQDIANQLTAASGLALTGTVAGDANLSRVQWAETDYDFLLQLVDDAECWMRPTESGVEVQSCFQPGPTLVWREGEYGLLEFAAGALVRPQTLAGTHYDPDTMQSQTFSGITSDATFYGDPAPGLVGAALQAGKAVPGTEQEQRQRTTELGDFSTRMELESRRASANALLCTGVSREPQVIAGDEITLTGLPVASGTYGVIACEHRWTSGGYENRFLAVPAQRWFAAERPPRAVASGLYPARVAANYDPHNQGRVQVQFAWMTEAPTTWARLLTAHAGADRGLLFYPEIGDEVAVRFESGDPERPVVVGSMWNGVQQPPTEGFWQPGTLNKDEFAANDIKRIVTKSGMRITLNDTPGQETIHLATPHSNQVTLTEKANETGRPAIALHTTGDIHIHAPQGRIHTQSQTRSRHTGDPQPVKLPAPPKPFDCKGNWAKVVAEVNKVADMKDPLARNKKITASYATIYKDDPDVKWAGLGAIVSRNAGCAMVQSQQVADDAAAPTIRESQNPMAEPPLHPIDMGKSLSAQKAHDALADTNQVIYRTVAPTMMFISKYSAKQLQQCMASGAIPVKNQLGENKKDNSKVPNDAVPPQLQGAVNKLAAAEGEPQGSAARAKADQSAADDIANYEQRDVVQQRIYDGHPVTRGVFATDQWMSKWQWGRNMGAVAPEVTMTGDCSSTDRVPFAGSIGDPNARVNYYNTLSSKFSSTDPTSMNNLMSHFQQEPGF